MRLLTRAPGLRERRIELCLSPSYPAQLAEVSPRTIVSLEAGGTVTDEQVRFRILRALDAPFDHMFAIASRN